MSDRVYAMCRKRALMALEGGQAVIVDAVHAKTRGARRDGRARRRTGRAVHRALARSAAEVMRDRVAARTGDVSDATPEVVDVQLGYDIGPQSFAVDRCEQAARPGRCRLPRADRREARAAP